MLLANNLDKVLRASLAAHYTMQMSSFKKQTTLINFIVPGQAGIYYSVLISVFEMPHSSVPQR
jgi:hypothetical protein